MTDIEYLDDDNSSTPSSKTGNLDVLHFALFVLGLYVVDMWIRTSDMVLTKFIPEEYLMDWRVVLLMSIVGSIVFIFAYRRYGQNFSIF